MFLFDYNPAIAEKYAPRLYQIRGCYVFRIRRVEPSTCSLCHADVFIFDIGSRIFIWCGNRAAIQKQVRACEVATKLKYETMKCKGTVEILDSNDEEAAFWKALGGKQEVTAVNVLNDEAIKLDEENTTWFYKINDNGEISQIQERPFVSTMLDSDSCFILDCETEVFIWNGKDAGTMKQHIAIILAKDFRTVFSDRPIWVPMVTIFEGEEPICFKEKFLYWEERNLVTPRKIKPSRVGNMKGREFDVMKMMISPPSPKVRLKEDWLIPPSKTKKWLGLKAVTAAKTECELNVWHSTDQGWVTLPEEEYGQFCKNSCYVYHQIITPEVGKCYSNIYFWQGCKSANRFWVSYKFEVCPLIEKQIVDMGGDVPKTNQEQQDKESLEFMNLFSGEIVYHESPRASPGRGRLYQIKTDLQSFSRGAECFSADISHFTSGDSFVFTPGGNFFCNTIYVWHGHGSPPKTRQFSGRVADMCLKERKDCKIVEVEEGTEPNELWQVLSTTPPKEWLKNPSRPKPRLFTCVEDLFSGEFTVSHSMDVCQSFLESHEVVILDAFYKVFVWVGSLSSQYKRGMAVSTATSYIARSTLGHPPSLTVAVIEEGKETPIFKAMFLAWRTKSSEYVDPFANKSKPRRIAFQEKSSPALTSILNLRSLYGDDDETENKSRESVQLENVSEIKVQDDVQSPNKTPPGNNHSDSERQLNKEKENLEVVDLDYSSPLGDDLSVDLVSKDTHPVQKKPSVVQEQPPAVKVPALRISKMEIARVPTVAALEVTLEVPKAAQVEKQPISPPKIAKEIQKPESPNFVQKPPSIIDEKALGMIEIETPKTPTTVQTEVPPPKVSKGAPKSPKDTGETSKSPKLVEDAPKSPKITEAGLESPKTSEPVLKSPKTPPKSPKNLEAPKVEILSPKIIEGVPKLPKDDDQVLKSPKTDEGPSKSPQSPEATTAETSSPKNTDKMEGIIKSPKITKEVGLLPSSKTAIEIKKKSQTPTTSYEVEEKNLKPHKDSDVAPKIPKAEVPRHSAQAPVVVVPVPKAALDVKQSTSPVSRTPVAPPPPPSTGSPDARGASPPALPPNKPRTVPASVLSPVELTKLDAKLDALSKPVPKITRDSSATKIDIQAVKPISVTKPDAPVLQTTKPILVVKIDAPGASGALSSSPKVNSVSISVDPVVVKTFGGELQLPTDEDEFNPMLEKLKLKQENSVHFESLTKVDDSMKTESGNIQEGNSSPSKSKKTDTTEVKKKENKKKPAAEGDKKETPKKSPTSKTATTSKSSTPPKSPDSKLTIPKSPSTKTATTSKSSTPPKSPDSKLSTPKSPSKLSSPTKSPAATGSSLSPKVTKTISSLSPSSPKAKLSSSPTTSPKPTKTAKVTKKVL